MLRASKLHPPVMRLGSYLSLASAFRGVSTTSHEGGAINSQENVYVPKTKNVAIIGRSLNDELERTVSKLSQEPVQAVLPQPTICVNMVKTLEFQ